MTHIHRLITTAVVAALTLTGMLGSMSAQSGHDLFQKALTAERAAGDLKQAIQLYEQIVKEFEKTDRALVASALVQLGQAYERLGSVEAKKRYERVTREFTDQADAVRTARMRLSALETEPTPTAAYRQVMVVPDGGFLSSVSHDGQYVPYINWNEGNLYVRSLKDGTVRKLTTDGRFDGGDDVVQYAEQAVISRNSTYVAFSWFARGRYEARLIDLRASAQPHVLYRHDDVNWIAPYDWSPDATWLAVLVSRTDRTAQIGALSIRDGSLKVLKSFSDWNGVTNLAISPDGRYVAFDASEAGGSPRDVFVMAADASREFRVVSQKGDDTLMGWAPGGAGIVFASDRGGSANLWFQEFNGTAPDRPPTLVRRDAGNAWATGMTRDGALYSVVRPVSSSTVTVVTVDFANGVLTAKPTQAIGEVPGIPVQADWSRDGKQLVYVSRRDRVGGGYRTILATRLVETGLTREYALELSNLYAPAFSPDGQRVVVTGYTRSGRQAAYVIDLSTGRQQPIAVAAAGERLLGPAAALTAASWSGDGQRVNYRRITRTGFRLFEHDLSSATEREVFSGSDPSGTAAFSPDGRKLYYRRLLGPTEKPMDMQETAFIERDIATGAEREMIRKFSLGAITPSPDGRHIVTGSVDPSGKSRSMLLISVEDGKSRELLQATRAGSGNPITPLAWAKDSQSILIRRAPAGSDAEEIWWAPVDGRAARQLLVMKSVSRTQIHPDGQRVVIAGAETPTPPEELWVLEGFLPKPPRSGANRPAHAGRGSSR